MKSILNKSVASPSSFFPTIGKNEKQLCGATHLFYNMIIKAKNFTKFAQVSNEVIRNKNLSLKAKGLFTILASLPEDWVIHKTQLWQFSNGGRDEAMRAFEELVKVGLILPVGRIRANGQLKDHDYIVYPEPQTITPITDFPKQAKPKQEKPKLENPQLTNTDNTNKDLTNKKITNTERGASTISPDLVFPSVNLNSMNVNTKKPIEPKVKDFPRPSQDEVFAVFDAVGKKNDGWAYCIEDEKFAFYFHYDARDWELSGGKKITKNNLRSAIVSWMHKTEKFL